MGWPKGWSSFERIINIEYAQWFVGGCRDQETKRNETVRMLREGNIAEEIWEAIGGQCDIQEAAFLFSEMCEYEKESDKARIFVESAEALETEMRGLRIHKIASGSSYRPGQFEQCGEKHTDAVQALSRLLAHYGEEAWKDGSWENAVPRITENMAARVDRLAALGNGQVPQSMALAWETLAGGVI